MDSVVIPHPMSKATITGRSNYTSNATKSGATGTQIAPTVLDLSDAGGNSTIETSLVVVNYTTPVVFGIDPSYEDLCLASPALHYGFFSDQMDSDGWLLFDSIGSPNLDSPTFQLVTTTLNKDNSISLFNTVNGASFIMDCDGRLSLLPTDDPDTGCVPIKLTATPATNAVIATVTATSTVTATATATPTA